MMPPAKGVNGQSKWTREFKNAYLRNWMRKWHSAAIAYYSNGDNCCECCGEVIQEFLCIDHIYGGGNIQRKEIALHGGSGKFARWLFKEGYPEGYRVMCFNCNMGRERTIDKQCPHKVG